MALKRRKMARAGTRNRRNNSRQDAEKQRSNSEKGLCVSARVESVTENETEGRRQLTPRR
jgi:hypothetical protein